MFDNEKYTHRGAGFTHMIMMDPVLRSRAWKSMNHNDGSEMDPGFFICGVRDPTIPGQARMHLTMDHWDDLVVDVVDKSPPVEGNDPQETAQWMMTYVRYMRASQADMKSLIAWATFMLEISKARELMGSPFSYRDTRHIDNEKVKQLLLPGRKLLWDDRKRSTFGGSSPFELDVFYDGVGAVEKAVPLLHLAIKEKNHALARFIIDRICFYVCKNDTENIVRWKGAMACAIAILIMTILYGDSYAGILDISREEVRSLASKQQKNDLFNCIGFDFFLEWKSNEENLMMGILLDPDLNKDDDILHRMFFNSTLVIAHPRLKTIHNTICKMVTSGSMMKEASHAYHLLHRNRITPALEIFRDLIGNCVFREYLADTPIRVLWMTRSEQFAAAVQVYWTDRWQRDRILPFLKKIPGLLHEALDLIPIGKELLSEDETPYQE